MRGSLLCCLSLVIHLGAAAQELHSLDSMNAFQNALEILLDEEDLEEDASQSIQHLIELQEDPINLNEANQGELRQIPGVSPLIAYRILAVRRETAFNDVSELLKVEGITNDLYESILPFVTVRSRKDFARPVSLQWRSRLQSDIEERRGYREGEYRGSRERVYQLIRGSGSPGRGAVVEGAVVFEKDAGERPSDGFLSGHISVSPSPAADVVMGDYLVESGNGLVLGRRNGMGNGAVFLKAERSERIIGYKSVNEADFFRGVAIQYRVSGISCIGFYSNKSVVGTVRSDSTLSGLSGTGLFRTQGDLEKRNASRERVVGGTVSTALHSGFRLSLKGYHARFMHRLAFNDAGALGPSFTSVGAAISFNDERVSTWAEAALEGHGSVAATAGAEFQMAGYGTVMMSVAAFGNGFLRMYGAGRPPVEKKEFHSSATMRVTEWLLLRGTWFLFTYPSGKDGRGFSVPDHGAGVSAMVRVSRSLQLDLRYKERAVTESEISQDLLGREVTVNSLRKSRGVRMNVVHGRRPVRWTSRIEYVRVERPSRPAENGFLLMQDLYMVPFPELQVQIRAAFFGTESFSSRLYSYEPDVPGTAGSRSLFGHGIRSAICVRIRPLHTLELSAAYARETKDGIDSFGSGWDEIQGDSHGRFSLQIDYRL